MKAQDPCKIAARKTPCGAPTRWSATAPSVSLRFLLVGVVCSLAFVNQAIASSASSEDIFMQIYTNQLPPFVFIDGLLTDGLPPICAPDVGTGGCRGPDIRSNIGPFQNFGGPYWISWAGQEAWSSAPSPNFADHGVTEQTFITFGNQSDSTVTFSVPWHMTYILTTDGISSFAKITTLYGEEVVGGGTIVPALTPLWGGDSIANGNPQVKTGEPMGMITIIVFPHSETALSIWDPEYATAAVPEPTSLLLFGSGVLGLSGFLRNRLLTRS